MTIQGHILIEKCLFLQVILLSGVTLSSGAVINSAENAANSVEQQAVNLNDFMPSHQVLFRRNDGELLLPAVNPYQG